MAKLIIRSGAGGENRVHEIKDDVTSIGRSGSNIIQIKDKEASRKHCRIVREGDGFVLYDEGSRNGVLVNGQRVKQQTLRPGDELRVGQFSVFFEEVRAASDDELGATVETSPLSESAAKAPQRAAGGPRFVIEIGEGRQKGMVIDLGSEPLTIGRNPANKFVIDDDSASSYHAEIVKEPTGHFLIDLGSTNGTRLGGEKLVKARLHSGDEIQIGTTKMLFKNLGRPSEEDDVFGTVVLDGDKLDRQLSEDEAKARAAAIRFMGIAVFAVLAVAVPVLAWFLFRSNLPEGVPGNLLENSSFSGGLSERGEPLGWRTFGSRLTPWQVITGDDRFADSSEPAALVVNRDRDAAIDERADCRTRDAMPVSAEKSFVLGGWIKTEAAQGIHGFQVRWTGRGDRSATDQVYLENHHPEWREIKRLVSPPAWATEASISCFSFGNVGKVFFDDVYFAASEDDAVARNMLEVRGSRIGADFSPAGWLGVSSGAKQAVRSGTIFLRVPSGAETTLEVAIPDEPRREGAPVEELVLGGTVPEITSLNPARYRVRVRPGEHGVVYTYEFSAQEGFPVDAAGLKFTVAPEFAANTAIYDDEGRRLERGSGFVQRARELVFSDGKGDELALLLLGDSPPLARIVSTGDALAVEIIAGRSPTIRSAPLSASMEFNAVSRYARLPVERAWRRHDEAVAAESLKDRLVVLSEIASMEERFSEDAAKASGILKELAASIDEEFSSLEGRIDELGGAEGTVFETLLQQVREDLSAAASRYSAVGRSEQVRGLDLKLARVVEARATRVRNEAAEQLYARIVGFLEAGNYPFTIALLGQLERDYAGTPAARKAAADGVRDRLAAAQREAAVREAALTRLQKRVDPFLRNNMLDEARRLLEGDVEFQSYREHPEFKALHRKTIVE